MKRPEANAELRRYRGEIAELEQKMRAVRAALEPEEVRDYEFSTSEGAVRLSELFGERRDLIVVHSMGASCGNCTLWADGYNGIYDHLKARAAFVIASADPPAVQDALKKERGWRFRMVSHQGNTFAADMGFRSSEGRWLPGLSSFQKLDGRLLHVSDADSKPGDSFCALWHLFDLLPGGAGDFKAKRAYP